ncbi:MAG: PQQ-binding-like beta-propeller repeat protein [Planctomycetota bacterium]|nr:PQQ-binding-like beta-propeller repeat protein [Planctomycetota bacterium]
MLFYLQSPLHAEEPSAFKLSAERQKIVDRYMDVLLSDARNDFAFRQVYGAFKAESKEFLLVNFFQNAIRLDPKKGNLHIILGKLYASFRDLFQAGVKFRDAVRLDADDYYARYLLADVHFKQRKFEEAATGYRLAAALASDMNDRVRSLHGLAQVHATLERFEDARKTWDEIAELLPFDANSFRKLTNEAKSFKKWELAERWLTKLLELLTEDSEGACFALVDLGQVEFEQKQFDKAVLTYRKAKTFLSESHWLSEELNARIRRCFEEKQELESLQEELESRVKKETPDVSDLLELAALRQAQGNKQSAADYLSAASQASPRDVQILERYRSVLVELSNDEGVTEASRRLTALSPQNVHYKLQDAEYHISQKHRESARAIWAAVIAEDKTQPSRFLSVGRAMKRAGELDWAEETYRNLIEVAPEIESHGLELAELYLLRSAIIPPGKEKPDPSRESPETNEWLALTQNYLKKANDLIRSASDRGKLTLAETQMAGQLLLDYRQLEESKTVIETGRKQFANDPGLARMHSEASLRLGASKARNSNEQNTLYDLAVRSAMEAFDLAPHPAIKQEMNSELLSLAMGYGAWGNNNRGGVRGLEPLLRKHSQDYFSHPQDPMPAWCIADIQQQAPESHFSFPDLKGGPTQKPFGFYTGDNPGSTAGLSFFSDALQRDPLFIPGYLGKSVAYVMRDSFEQSVVELRKASVIDPVNKWKYFLRIGDLFADQGQMGEALAFWGRVSERVFTDATVFYQLATRYFRAEKTEDALEMLGKAIEANPNIHSYYMTRGNIYDYLGDYPTAVHQYRKALELSSQSMLLPVRQRLSEIQRSWAYDLFDKNDTAKALAQFEEIRAFQEVLEKYYRNENDERSLKRLSPEAADVQVQIARCMEFLNRENEAQAIYSKVSDELPTAPIRLSKIRTISLKYYLDLRSRQGRLLADNFTTAGDIQPRPFKLRLLRHTQLYDVARTHSVTQAGVIYSGLARWAEVEPITGEILRQMKPGKAILYNDGVEVQVHRVSLFDQIRITKSGKSVEVTNLPSAKINVPSMQTSADRLVFYARVESQPRLVSVDPDTGGIQWSVPASMHTQELVSQGKYVASIEAILNISTLVVRESATGKMILTKELPQQGIWLQPVINGDKVFLCEDTTWQLHMMDIATGEFDYSITFSGTFPRPPVIHEDVLYLHVRGYKARSIYLYAINPGTGQILWKTDMQSMSVHSPPIFRGDDIVYLNPETHRIFMIDNKTGVRHSEASYKEQMTKQQRDYIQFMRPYKEHLLIVGGRGDIHAFAVE